MQKSHRGSIPIFIGYDDLWKDPNIRQTVTFESCLFEDMDLGSTFAPKDQYWETAFSKLSEHYHEFASLIVATHASNTVVLRDCTFRVGNENVKTAVRVFCSDCCQPCDGNLSLTLLAFFHQEQLPRHLVTSLGAEVVVEKSCFNGNGLGTGGSPILLGHKADSMPTIKFDATDNFVKSPTDCNFVSEMLPDGVPPSCNENVTATAIECLSTAKDLVLF